MYEGKVIEKIHLPVALYGHQTWSITLRKEHKLQVFENKVFRKILGPKKVK
jgi:hypothetical protein